MRNFSLNQKMFAVITVLLLGGAAIAFISLAKMADVRSYLQEITGVHLKRQLLISQIQLKFDAQSIVNKNIIIERSTEKKHALAQDLVNVSRELDQAIDDYERIASPDGRALAAKYREALTNLRGYNKQILELSEQGDDEEASRLTSEFTIPLRKEAERYVKEMHELTARKLMDLEASAKTSYEDASNQVLAISLMSLLLGVGLASFVLRSISRSINHVISSLRDNSTQVAASAQQIASSSSDLSQAASQQAASLEETSAAVEEMDSMVKQNAESSKNSVTVADASSSVASKGKKVVEGMIVAMNEINIANSKIMEQVTASNRSISDIVKVIAEISNKTKVINDIVFQTKLLSFNASVEAARAGEHGKGFAVVAEEVGNLAQMSGNAAKEISLMLDGSIVKVEGIVTETSSRVESLIAEGKAKVEAGSIVARQCGDVLDEIVRNFASVTSMVGDISSASEEQARGISEITKAMAQLDQVTQQNAAVSEEAASAAEELAAQAESMREVVQVLVHAIKGGRDASHFDQSKVRAVQPSLASEAVQPPATEKGAPGKLIQLRSNERRLNAHGPAVMAPGESRRVVGGASIPDENDPRFNEV